MPNFMIYGATGFTGSLIAREAARRGMRPILAGRSVEAVAALATELGLEHRVFALDASSAVGDGLRGVHTLLHCAGPFSRTSRPMADACLRTGTHYLDITGEEQVFEALAARDAEARAAKVVLLPGVGFDVVPSDCLAAHLKRRLPTATRLSLGFQGGDHMSHGTALTVLESLPHGGLVRANGFLKRVPAAWRTRVIDFGNGPVRAITIPWGDVATAFYSTGIPNIEFYMAAPWGTRVLARISRYFSRLLGSRFVQSWLRRCQPRSRIGPLLRSRGPTYSGRNYGFLFPVTFLGHSEVGRFFGARLVLFQCAVNTEGAFWLARLAQPKKSDVRADACCGAKQRTKRAAKRSHACKPPMATT